LGGGEIFKNKLMGKAGMLAGQNFFHKTFARVSPVFLVAALSFISAPFSHAARSGAQPRMAVPLSSEDSDRNANRRQAATAQFAHAEDLRAELNSKPAEKRTLSEYKQVVASYRRVYLITPHASEVPDALLAAAELYSEMGDRFGRSYFQSAVDTYQFLMREYPKSKYAQDAYLRAAKLQQDQLGDAAGAIQTYETFLKKFPRSPHKREAQEARAELALLQNSATAETPKSAIAKSVGVEPERPEAANSKAARDAGSNSEKESSGANETSAAVNLTGARPQIHKISAKASQNSTRVTVELESGVQYISGRIANPDRIYFDLQNAKLTPQLAHTKIPIDGTLLTAVRVAQNPMGIVRIVLDVNGVTDYTASLLNHPSRLVIDLYANGKPAQPMQTAKSNGNSADTSAQEHVAENITPEKSGEKPQPAATTTAKSARADGEDPLVIPQPKNKLGSAKTGKKSDMVQPASAPQPTRDGNSTLTRALGLKIGRIVIDAGHGGHDTGTIGPTGLMEKDLCLDVALRLGKIIQQRLPGADVVYTRSDDTFIPLEERTHIANEAKADMFISIHANSSQDSGARGIETYYLNLKGSAEAMEVAARENATDDQGIHELQDMVKQIARTEKIDESREFAADVQDSLSKRVQKTAKTVKNRGVRKAPFVVLIGADMPSILTEISFLSNPADEKMLKQPEHRQRVAEGIYQGVASYLQSLNSMGVSQSAAPVPQRTSTSASVEDSRNRN
jgi:N-acetylmuramoyl-L-alanine amidase